MVFYDDGDTNWIDLDGREDEDENAEISHGGGEREDRARAIFESITMPECVLQIPSSSKPPQSSSLDIHAVADGFTWRPDERDSRRSTPAGRRKCPGLCVHFWLGNTASQTLRQWKRPQSLNMVPYSM